MFAVASELDPRRYLESIGRVFACFDRQDSGNVSFGVLAGGQRYFAKTAGAPDADGLPTSHAQRLALLANAERLAMNVSHPALTCFEATCETAWGRMAIYRWADGEHLHEPRPRRNAPNTPRQRFLNLPWEERLAAVLAVVDLHRALAARQFVVGDFYDGCLLYDFDARRIRVFDLDHYQQGAYRNTMGRMFGSTRFMAPEEFERGRAIDERTTVFAMGRLLSIFLGERVAPVADMACAPEPENRYVSMEALWAALRFSGVASRP